MRRVRDVHIVLLFLIPICVVVAIHTEDAFVKNRWGYGLTKGRSRAQSIGLRMDQLPDVVHCHCTKRIS